MAYINEYIPKEDFEKYNIQKLMKTRVIGGISSRDWTIDRETGSWLYNYAIGVDRDEGYKPFDYWYFFWQEHLIHLITECIESKGGGRNQHYRARFKLIEMKLPPTLISQRDKLLSDLQAALSVYGPGGMSGRSLSSKVELIA